MRSLVFAIIVAAIVLLAFACNGDGEGLRTVTPTPSPEPTPATTSTPQATATATAVPTAAPEIAYVGPDERDVWLMAIDAGGKRNLTRGRCPHGCRLYWSPNGDRIACIDTVYADPSQTQVLVFDPEGRVLLRLQHAGYFLGFTLETRFPTSLWSPSGRRLAYVVEEHVPSAEGEESQRAGTPALIVADATRGILASIPGGQWPRWSADRDRLAYYQARDDALAVYDPASGQEEALGEDLRPLAWALGGKKLLVAADYQEQELGATYEANLLDPTSGQMTRIPQLDNLTEFWLSPDGVTAVVLRPSAGRPSLGILNLSTLEFTPIAGSVISYPSDFIPQTQLVFSADGSQIHWFDGSDAIYKADIDDGSLTQVGRLPGDFFLTFAPDLARVLYLVLSDAPPAAPGGPLPWNLWVASIDGSDAHLVVEGALGAVWRPTP
jgi:dipeptidyl aminopeptidase/acylaminoacyl peptidase